MLDPSGGLPPYAKWATCQTCRRALVSNASRIIAVINHVIPLESGRFFQNPFHGALLAGIDQALCQHRYYLMVRTIDTVPEPLSFLNNCNIDGLIISGIFPQPFYQSLLVQRQSVARLAQ